MQKRLNPNFEFGVLCHPEPAVLSGGRRISAVVCIRPVNPYEVRALVPSSSFEATPEEAFDCSAGVCRQE
jgi:hypothetical protein